jgi:undecaprenyl-diphosphatase
VISAALSRGVLTPLIRFFYYHPRPFDIYQVRQLIPESGASFPSGHAMFFFALAAALYFYNKKWGVWFFLATALMCTARVMAGVHFPSDILGGMVLGSAVAYLVDRYARRHVERYLSRMVR